MLRFLSESRCSPFSSRKINHSRPRVFQDFFKLVLCFLLGDGVFIGFSKVIVTRVVYSGYITWCLMSCCRYTFQIFSWSRWFRRRLRILLAIDPFSQSSPFSATKVRACEELGSDSESLSVVWIPYCVGWPSFTGDEKRSVQYDSIRSSIFGCADPAAAVEDDAIASSSNSLDGRRIPYSVGCRSLLSSALWSSCSSCTWTTGAAATSCMLCSCRPTRYS